jgi:hypothetical protein
VIKMVPSDNIRKSPLKGRAFSSLLTSYFPQLTACYLSQKIVGEDWVFMTEVVKSTTEAGKSRTETGG